MGCQEKELDQCTSISDYGQISLRYVGFFVLFEWHNTASRLCEYIILLTSDPCIQPPSHLPTLPAAPQKDPTQGGPPHSLPRYLLWLSASHGFPGVCAAVKRSTPKTFPIIPKPRPLGLPSTGTHHNNSALALTRDRAALQPLWGRSLRRRNMD